MTSIIANIKNLLDIIVVYFIPISAFIFSLVALIASHQNGKLEKRLTQLEIEIKETQAEMLKQVRNRKPKANLDAIIHKTSGNYVLEVKNMGTNLAKDINIVIPEEFHIGIIKPESKNSLPLQLEPRKSIQLELSITTSSNPYFILIINWKEDNEKNESVQKETKRNLQIP